MTETPQRLSRSELGDWIRTILWAFLLAVVLRSFLYEPFRIPSASMKPTLWIGDYVLVSKFSYGYSRYSLPFWNPPFSGRFWGALPARGDVAVFRLPSDPRIDYIKRIVGLPGDRLQMVAGILVINGIPVTRLGISEFSDPETGHAFRQFLETLPNGVQHPILQDVDDGPFDNTEIFTVPDGHVFAMGDNRENSRDSRVPGGLGYVPLDHLIGRAELRFFSATAPTPTPTPTPGWHWPLTIRFDRMLTVVR